MCEKCGNTFSSRPVRLFFSYGHDANESLVNKIKTDLETRGHNVWIDTSQIKEGNNWRRMITDGIHDSEVVMAFLSKYSVRIPGVCRDELSIAVGMKYGNIKTVLVEDKAEVDPPSFITENQWIDMHDWQERKKSQECEPWYQAKLQEIIDIVESDETVAYVQELDRIREALRVELSEVSEVKEQKLLEQPMFGRDWLMTELETWRTNEPSSRVFLLYGDPGVGKSRFAADLMHQKEKKAIAGVYCVKEIDTYNRADTIAKILAVKIAVRLPDYRKHLLKIVSDLEKYGKDDTGVDWFDTLLIHPLNHLIDGNRDRLYIVIDGLDEAEERSGNVLARTLANILTDLPSWLGVVITSRPEPDIITVFSGYHPHILDAGSEQNLQDIHDYLSVNLNEIFDKRQDLDRKVVLDNLVRASEGSFLYAVSIVQEIRENAFDLTNPDAYPRGMNGFYAANFARKFETKMEFEMVYPALSLLVAADSLPIPMMEEILEKKGLLSLREFSAFENKLGSFLRRNPNVTRKDEELSFYHKCLGDWLKNHKDNPLFYVDPREGGRLLAPYAREKIGTKKRIDTETISNDYLAYLQLHIISYYVVSGMHGELRTFLQEEDTPIFPYWCQAADVLPECADAMWVRISNHVDNAATKELVDDLHNAAKWFEENYKCDVADKLYQQMIAACRNLPNQDNDETQVILAGALFRYGCFSQKLNHYLEMEIAYTESLATYRNLASTTPSTYLPDVALTLNNLVDLYTDTHRFDEAEKAVTESLDIRRGLAAANPEVYLPDVAETLNSLAALYHSTNRFDEALAACTESLDILRPLATANPDVYLPDVAEILNNLAALYHSTNRFDEALDVFTESLDIRRGLASANPAAYLPNVALVLNNLGVHYHSTNHFDEALAACTESLDTYRTLATAHPAAYLPDVALTLNNLAALYYSTNHFDEALAARTESLDTYRTLATANPAAYLPDVALTLNNLAALYHSTNRFDEALVACTESLDTYRTLATAHPAMYLPAVAQTLNKLSNHYYSSNRLDEAKEARTEADEITRKLMNRS